MSTVVEIAPDILGECVALFRSAGVHIIGSEANASGAVSLRVDGEGVPDQPKSTCTVHRDSSEAGISLRLEFVAHG